MATKDSENMVTYCLCCGSTIYWDCGLDPVLVRAGDGNLLTCLKVGCSLMVVPTGERMSNFELVRRRLIEAGVPEEAALAIATIVSSQSSGTAAA